MSNVFADASAQSSNPPSQLVSKLPDVGTTIFTVMSQMAVDHNAINLGQGFPDFNPDERLVNAVTTAMKEGHNQYPPMAGILPLREQIATKINTLYGHAYDPATEITVTSGASEALISSIMALVNPGDEVIVIEPFYDLYIPSIQLAGGMPVVVPMVAPNLGDRSEPQQTPLQTTENSNRFYIDWDRVRRAITANTRMIILNFPHNPTGVNLRDSDLDALEKIVEDTGIFVLSDEVYEHIVFRGQKHASLCSRPGLAEKSIVISSFGKTYHVTGWKVGYCCAPQQIMAEIRKVHQFMVFTVSSPMQFALAEFMADPSPYMQLASFYEKKHDRLFQGLKQTKIIPLASEGTFFLLAQYGHLSKMNEADYAKWLTTEIGVAVIPVSAFYQNPDAPSANHGLIRFCFAKQDDTLDEAIERLKKL